MKRIIVLLLLAICLFICSSCTLPSTLKEGDLKADVYPLEVNGHVYLVAVFPDGQKTMSHDPDCKQCARNRIIKLFPSPSSQPASAPAEHYVPKQSV